MGRQRGTIRARTRKDGESGSGGRMKKERNARKRARTMNEDRREFKFEVPEDDPLLLAEEDLERQEKEEAAAMAEYYAKKEVKKKKDKKSPTVLDDQTEADLEAALDEFEARARRHAGDDDDDYDEDEDEDGGQEDEDDKEEDEEDENEEDEQDGQEDEEDEQDHEQDEDDDFGLSDDLLEKMSKEFVVVAVVGMVNQESDLFVCVHRLEQKSDRETVKMAQEAAASRRAQIAQKRRAEEQARKTSAYPDATRVFVFFFHSSTLVQLLMFVWLFV